MFCSFGNIPDLVIQTKPDDGGYSLQLYFSLLFNLFILL